MFTRRRRVTVDRLPSPSPATAPFSTAIVRDRRAMIAPRGRGWVWLPVRLAETPLPHPWRPTIGLRPGRAGKAVLPPAHLSETPCVHAWRPLIGLRPGRAGKVMLPPAHLSETPCVHAWRPLVGLRPGRAGKAMLPPAHLFETPCVHAWRPLIGQRPPRRSSVSIARSSLPGSPALRGYAAQQMVGRGRVRSGRAVVPPSNLSETPIAYPWRPVIGQHPPRPGVASVAPAHLPETPVIRGWAITALAYFRQSGWTKLGSLLPPPLPKIPFAVPTQPVRDQQPWLRRRRGWILRWPPANIAAAQAVWYHVYANTGAGDPINYEMPVATVDGLSWTTAALSYPGDWKFGVRAFYDSSGLEEQNLDCAVEIVLDSGGNDITNRPEPPTGLRALAIAGGNIKVEWSYPNPASVAKMPTGFNVYIGVGSVSYVTPAATVSYAASIMNAFTAVLTGLESGTTYTIGVRANNATAEELNANTVSCTSDATGPSSVECLTGVAI